MFNQTSPLQDQVFCTNPMFRRGSCQASKEKRRISHEDQPFLLSSHWGTGIRNTPLLSMSKPPLNFFRGLHSADSPRFRRIPSMVFSPNWSWKNPLTSPDSPLGWHPCGERTDPQALRISHIWPYRLRQGHDNYGQPHFFMVILNSLNQSYSPIFLEGPVLT